MKKFMHVFLFVVSLILICSQPAMAAGSATRYLYGALFLNDMDNGANSCIILENRGDTPAECAINYYGRDGRLVKSVDNLTMNPKEIFTRFVAKDLGTGRAQGTVEVSVKSGDVTGRMAFFLYQGRSVSFSLPLQAISRTSLLCRCFNEVELNGDGVVSEAGEVKTEIALKNPDSSVARFKYVIYDAEGKGRLKEGTGQVPGHGMVVFSPRTALKGDLKANIKTKGSVSFEVAAGSLVGHACLFNSEAVSLEVLKDNSNQQVNVSVKSGVL